jgi:hypothetical protein
MGPHELLAKLEEQIDVKSPDVRIDWAKWDRIRRRSRAGAIDDQTFGMLRGLEEKRFAATKEA